MVKCLCLRTNHIFRTDAVQTNLLYNESQIDFIMNKQYSPVHSIKNRTCFHNQITIYSYQPNFKNMSVFFVKKSQFLYIKLYITVYRWFNREKQLQRSYQRILANYQSRSIQNSYKITFPG